MNIEKIEKKLFNGLDNFVPLEVAMEVTSYVSIDQSTWIDIWHRLKDYDEFANQRNTRVTSLLKYLTRLASYVKFNFEKLNNNLPPFLQHVVNLTLGIHDFNSVHGLFKHEYLKNIQNLTLSSVKTLERPPKNQFQILNLLSTTKKEYVDLSFFVNLHKLKKLHLNNCGIALGVGKYDWVGSSNIEKLEFENSIILSGEISGKKYPKLKKLSIVDCTILWDDGEMFEIDCDLKKFKIHKDLKNYQEPSKVFPIKFNNISKLEHIELTKAIKQNLYLPKTNQFKSLLKLHTVIVDAEFINSMLTQKERFDKFSEMFKNAKNITIILSNTSPVNYYSLKHIFKSIISLKLDGNNEVIPPNTFLYDVKQSGIPYLFFSNFLNDQKKPLENTLVLQGIAKLEKLEKIERVKKYFTKSFEKNPHVTSQIILDENSSMIGYKYNDDSGYVEMMNHNKSTCSLM